MFMGGITALAAISVEIVVPATGIVARYFDLPEARGASLVGVYFLSYGTGQIFWGLYSDAFGRRIALLLSLAGFALASLACALAPSFEWLLIGRCAQGAMAGAPVTARAMVRDATSGAESARIMTLLGAILTVTTLFAPVLGSGFLILFSWRVIFLALMLLALVFLIYSYVALTPTNERCRRERFSLRFLRQATQYLPGNQQFLVPTLIGGFIFGGYASLGAVGAITAEEQYCISPGSFGALFTIAVLANVSGSLFASRLLRRINLRAVGTLSMAILAVLTIIHVVIAQAQPSLQLFWVTICIYVFVFGMTLPTTMAASLEPAGEMPAFAASVFGACIMGMAFLGAVTASRLYDGDHQAISLTMAPFGAAAVMVAVAGRVLGRPASPYP
ncbi:hypothetical protein RA27_17685 [Ruegeria sp. ANG-R]|nr:hypothetical protein RA27_17685 [Ruegeria sp. ANG-R]